MGFLTTYAFAKAEFCNYFFIPGSRFLPKPSVWTKPLFYEKSIKMCLLNNLNIWTLMKRKVLKFETSVYIAFYLIKMVKIY